MVVLPVFVQAPWVNSHPFSTFLFGFILLAFGLLIEPILGEKYQNIGALIMGVSWSWFGGCLFWGWLRGHPIWHLPVESIALPFAIISLQSKFRIGGGFYLASLLGTAFTDLMILLTGVMKSWPLVVEAPFEQAPKLLNQTAYELLKPLNISLILIAGLSILLISLSMQVNSTKEILFSETWLVASAALSTTLWVDGLFLITTIVQPNLSGLV